MFKPLAGNLQDLAYKYFLVTNEKQFKKLTKRLGIYDSSYMPSGALACCSIYEEQGIAVVCLKEEAAPEETTGVRITQKDIYEKLLELQSVQIEIVADLKNLKDLPSRMNRVEQKLARFEWIEKLSFSALGAGLTGFVAALWSLLK